MRRAYKTRIAWEDRFSTPEVAELLAEFNKQQQQLIDQVRSSLTTLAGVSESVTWLGIPWRWTLSYTLGGSGDRPFAYLVPQPGKPLLAIPMSSDTVKSLPVRRLPKFIRDVIMLSPRVGGVHWLQWELTGRSMADELLALARRKHDAVLDPVDS